jgi:hypothetical protein
MDEFTLQWREDVRLKTGNVWWPPSYCRDRGSFLSMWLLWWTKWQWARFFNDNFSFPLLSAIKPLFHTYSTLVAGAVGTSETEARRYSIRGGIHNFRDWCCHLYCSCSSAMQRKMLVLDYLGSQCTKFYAAGWRFWYLRPFNWSRDAILRWIRQRNSIKSCANLGEVATESLVIQTMGEERMSRTWKIQTHRDRKKKD